MTSLVQSTDESIYAYVMRTIEIRQKVLLASQKASGKGEISFDKDLVMKLFLRTLERGIISQYVVQEIRNLLKSSCTPDEELISAVTNASALEKKRSTFQRRNKKQVKVFEVSSGSRSGSVSEESTITKLVSAVDKLTSKVSSLRPELNDLKESNQVITDSNKFVSRSSRFKNCNKCYKNNFEYCNHCFHCGSGKHFLRDCPSTKYKKHGN